MKMRQLAVIFALGLIVSIIPVSSSNGADTAAIGAASFDAYCSKCHGLKGVGTDKGPPLVHKIYEPNHHSDMSFRWAAERGVVAHHWTFGNMPKVAGIKPDEVEAVIKYVRQLQRDAGIQ